MVRRSDVLLQIFKVRNPVQVKEAEDYLEELLPRHLLNDYGLIKNIVGDYAQIRGMTVESLYAAGKRAKGMRKLTHERRCLLGVACLMYHPEKLHFQGLPPDLFPRGFVKTLSIELNSTQSSISDRLSETIFYFNRYPEFRQEVLDAHKELLNKYTEDDG